MKKIGLIFKDTSAKLIKDSIKDSSSLFVIKYSGLSSPDLTSLRQNLKTANSRIFVVKNSVARRALKDSGLDIIIKSIEGPCGLIFAKDEPVNASKVLYNFAKDHEQLKIEAGLFNDQILEKKDIETMAKLPSKEMLRAQVVMTLNSPILKLVLTLKGNLRKLVYCLEQIKQKKPA
ncbi:MAG: 50S ribosomal protein L10 [Candidatus Omnitrophica bacterium]|nr:50S ribosomal protein L10 [Candidatus Omnitrophota bacterium]